MKMRKSGLLEFLKSLLAVLFVVCASRGQAAEKRPNIVVIMADDLGYGELGCYGGKEIPTPHLDALASSGARFTNAYVTAPFCAASRAAILTARYQTRFGFEFNPIGAKNAAPGVGLPLSEKTIPQQLRDSGYVSGLVGKWHLGGTAEFHPQRRGFDEFFGFLHEGHYYVPFPWQGVTTWLRKKSLPDGGQGRWTSPDGRIVWSTHMGYNEHEYDTDNPLLRSSQPVDEKADLTSAFTREACAFVQRNSSQPFFLVLAFSAVHSPMQATDAYMAKFAHIPDIHRRIFAGMLSQLDDSVGQLVAQLRSSGLEENTLVVFLSDNGGPTNELTSSNAPLRGQKGQLWEGGIRVPFLASWKGRIAPGRVVDASITAMDIGVTALELAKVAPGKTKLDGASLMPMLSGATDAPVHENLFWRVGKMNAVRHGDWKMIREGGSWRLFDLKNDIAESTDLAAREPARVKEISGLWDQWNAEQVDPLWR